jgi:chromatin remodeling complex protein RSC6
MTDVDNAQPLQEPVSTSEKFEVLLKDLSAHVDVGKSLTSRMKALQKEVSKATKTSKRRSVKSESDTDSEGHKRPSALQKPVKISSELCNFLEFEPDKEYSRQDVTKAVNKYIKDNDIQCKDNRRFINLEDTEKGRKLKVLLREPDQPVTFFNIQRYLKPHYPSKEEPPKVVQEPPKVVQEPPKVVQEPPKVVQEPPKVTKQAAKVVNNLTEVVPDLDVVEESPKAPKRRVVKRTAP